MTKQRLNKTLASAGIASRRASEEFILAGRIAVNGETIRKLQTLVDLETDTITLDGRPLKLEKKVYYILNKPAGYLCSTQGKRVVLDLFEGVEERLFTVGRLDKDTEGLIIVTNDGDYAQKVIHPSANIQKEYIAKTDQEITEKHLKILSKGVHVEGAFVKPLRVEKVRKGTVKVIVMEGKKREVRELLQAADLTVLQLKRVRIGNLHLNHLPVGHYRPMTEKEKKQPFGG